MESSSDSTISVSLRPTEYLFLSKVIFLPKNQPKIGGKKFCFLVVVRRIT